MKTVKELKEFLKDLPDDMLILKKSDNFELRGAIDAGIYVKVGKYKATMETFVDGFDYESYQHEVYQMDDNGIECLQIM